MKKLLTIIIALAFTTLPSIAKVKDAMFIIKNATPTQTTYISNYTVRAV